MVQELPLKYLEYPCVLSIKLNKTPLLFLLGPCAVFIRDVHIF